jgi:hypothetical protein
VAVVSPVRVDVGVRRRMKGLHYWRRSESCGALTYGGACGLRELSWRYRFVDGRHHRSRREGGTAHDVNLDGTMSVVQAGIAGRKH